MSASDDHDPFIKMICDHFPECVDIVYVDKMQFDELVADVPEEVFKAKLTDPDHTDISPYCRRIPMNIPIEELEPETGVHAVMSEITHRVFVFKDMDNPKFYEDYPEDYRPNG